MTMSTTTVTPALRGDLLGRLCSHSFRLSPLVVTLFMWSIWHAYERSGTANSAGLFDVLLGLLIMALSLPGLFASRRDWRTLLNVTLGFIGLNILVSGLVSEKSVDGFLFFAGQELDWYISDAASYLNDSIVLGLLVYLGGYLVLAGMICLAAMFFWFGAFQGEGYEGRRLMLRIIFIVIVLGVTNQPILGLLL